MLYQGDCLALFASECINQGQIGCVLSAVKCVPAFWFQFNCATSFPDRVLLRM